VSTSPSAFAISKRTGTLIGCLILGLVVLNLALIIQNRNLRGSQARGNSVVLKEGDLVPSLSGLDIDGKEFTLDFTSDSRKALILIFSPRCGYCTKNMPNWTAIADGLDRRSFRIVEVSTISEGVREYVDQYRLTGVPVVSDVDPKTRVAYEMNVTPQTILIDSHGRVEKIWTGVLQRDELTEVSRFLNLTLPT
jgi:peroxiredoxin